MKQVTQQDFEVLKKYHPHEVRYYVELTAPAKTNGRTGPVVGTKHNRRVQLTTKRYAYRPNSISDRVHKAAVKVLDNDPTALIGRVDLMKQVGRRTGLARPKIKSAVSSMLEHGLLRYAGTNGA